ncbi:MAG: hypothetical protein VB049_03680 [Candidatus Pelethousia sp.]|nr:hypothetical protein [Candidatus Pelethousia sp.]
MKRMNLKAALLYDLWTSLRSIRIFIIVMALVWLAGLIMAVGLGSDSLHLNGFEVAAAIFAFVTGIVSVREDLRLFLQNGCGRPTTFVLQLILAVFLAIVLAVTGGLLLELFRLVSGWVAPQIKIVSIYQLMGMAEGKNRVAAMLSGMGYIFFQSLPACLGGMAVSLLYYRLNKLGKVAVSIAVPVTLFIGIPVYLGTHPVVAHALASLIGGFIHAFSSTLALTAVLSFALAIFFALGSWLLLRRAPVN